MIGHGVGEGLPREKGDPGSGHLYPGRVAPWVSILVDVPVSVLVGIHTAFLNEDINSDPIRHGIKGVILCLPLFIFNVVFPQSEKTLKH